MNEIARQMIEDALNEERDWKARNPEPKMDVYPFEKELELLLASGFIVKDEPTTELWKRGQWMQGRLVYHQCYTWTPEGKRACFRSQHSTPMAWAADIHFENTRHCVVCGRDCYRQKVWASDGRFRCVCMVCGGKGHGLQDLAESEQEKQEAIRIEQGLAAMDGYARKQAREIARQQTS